MKWLVLLAIGLLACNSGDDDDDTPSAGSGESGSGGSQAGSKSESGSSGAGNAGSGNNAGSGSKAGTGGSGEPSEAGSNADAGVNDAGKTLSGVCGERGEGTVSETEIEGFQELYVIGDDGFGDEVCVVRFEITRVGDAPEGCGDVANDKACLWTHTIELSNPMVMLDVDGACASSELGLDQATIDALDGTQASYGFVSMFVGHNSVLMKYDESSQAWNANGNATWNEDTGMFRYDRRDGLCDY